MTEKKTANKRIEDVVKEELNKANERIEEVQEFIRKEEQKHERIKAIKRTIAYFGLGLGVGMMATAFVGAVSETIAEGLQ